MALSRALIPSFTRCCVFNFHCLLWRRFFFLATRYRQKHETQQSELVMKSSVVIIQVGLNLISQCAHPSFLFYCPPTLSWSLATISKIDWGLLFQLNFISPSFDAYSSALSMTHSALLYPKILNFLKVLRHNEY
jgi:hypothetical protein